MVSIAFTGGGTGGHIYPGLAAASALQKLIPCRIFWIGSGRGVDRSIVESAGLEFFGIPAGKLRRNFSLKNFPDFFRVWGGFFAARRILKREKPALLFSKGGFVSVPPCAAAASLKIPVFTHESDYSPGLATRINARFAKKIFVPYGESAAFFSPALRKKVEVSGNPIRAAFAFADPARGRAFLGIPEGEPILLVLGGSLGSREINGLVRACLPGLTRLYTVVHQTGVQDEAFVPQERYKPYPYFNDEMPHVIAAADLVLCRSGAGTIWECASLKKPMILLPLRGSGTRGDQVENARIFEKAGAALNLAGDPADNPPDDPPDRPLPERLVSLVALLAGDGKRRASAGQAKFDGFGSADYIARAVVREITEGE
jgi:UDP-N-acetylglucosamine--N-acetylmuramyl-(pentapeptide) pyrophosphoryl-undecaprenol N-acetylglucosamine transferase